MISSAVEGAVVYGLGAVRGVGEGPVAAIVEARESGGPFTTLREFCERLDTRKVNKRVIEALVRSGAMDGLGDVSLDLNARRGHLLGGIGGGGLDVPHVVGDHDVGLSGGVEMEDDVGSIRRAAALKANA